MVESHPFESLEDIKQKATDDLNESKWWKILGIYKLDDMIKDLETTIAEAQRRTSVGHWTQLLLLAASKQMQRKRQWNANKPIISSLGHSEKIELQLKFNTLTESMRLERELSENMEVNTSDNDTNLVETEQWKHDKVTPESVTDDLDGIMKLHHIKSGMGEDYVTSIPPRIEAHERESITSSPFTSVDHLISSHTNLLHELDNAIESVHKLISTLSSTKSYKEMHSELKDCDNSSSVPQSPHYLNMPTLNVKNEIKHENRYDILAFEQDDDDDNSYLMERTCNVTPEEFMICVWSQL